MSKAIELAEASVLTNAPISIKREDEVFPNLTLASGMAVTAKSLLDSEDEARSTLFEHHGLFGATPGTWSPPARTIEPELESSDDEEDAQQMSPCLDGETCRLTSALFEQYGLFGAEPGWWSTTA